jgi:hypothetical protein|uniref:Uncharacterized protein n=1 Tax=viral metagenome TaxID=1070528 RepID=A0A6C0ASV9_9ZZZZ
MNLSTLVRSLPPEVLTLIIPYTYQPQSRILLEDIRDFHSSRQTAFYNYRRYWIEFTGEEIPEDKHWLYNDLVYEMNKPLPTMRGYTDNFYNVWFRNPMFMQNKARVDAFIRSLTNEYLGADNGNVEVVTRAINLYFGILTPQERAHFNSRSISP